jgi:hypothetical protein
MLNVICSRSEFKWGLHKSSPNWPLGIPDIQYFNITLIYLMLSAKGLIFNVLCSRSTHNFKNLIFKNKHIMYLSSMVVNIRIVFI